MKEVNILLKKIDEDLKKELSESRYKHSIGTMNKAEELARLYNVDVNKAKLVGLAHDIAKEMSRENKIKYVKENNIYADEIERMNIGLLHAKIGADICKKRYGFSLDMQDAIKYHTTGNEHMDDLAKVLLIADKTEEGRDYKDLKYIKDLANNSLNDAIIYIIDITIKKTIENKKLIHPDSVNTRNRLIIDR